LPAWVLTRVPTQPALALTQPATLLPWAAPALAQQ
jgi:hypothetical protein